MTTYVTRLIAAAAATAVLGVLISGCAGDSDREQIAAAKSSLEKKDNKAAIIQLKSALQKNPQSGEARFLLGEALLGGGEPAAAVVQLEKARDVKYSNDLVLPLLAKAMFSMGQSRKIIDLFAGAPLNDAKAASNLNSWVAASQFVEGNVAAAAAAVDAALRFDAKNSNARLLHARLAASSGDIEGALREVEAVIADESQNADAWSLKGELSWFGKSDLDSAVKSFREVLVIRPRDARAHALLLKLMLQKRDLQGFKEQAARMQKVLPEHPETRFADIQLALVENDLKRAREGAQQLLRFAPSNAHVLQLAGAIEFRGGALVAAETHVGKALALVPGLVLARRLLSEIYLRGGQPAKALVVLQPLLAKPVPDAQVLALAAEAYLQSGDLPKAEKYYTLAAKAAPEDTEVRIALALSKLAKGNVDAGFLQLEQLTANDKGTNADLALISARLRRNEFDEALRAIDKMQLKLPGKPLPDFLRGQILTRRKDLVGAQVSYERALSVDPVYFPAVTAMAAIALSQRKPADALKRYQALLARDPTNFRAQLAVADLRQIMGANSAEVGALLATAVKSNSSEPTPRLAQIDYLLSRYQAKEALYLAQEAVSVFPDNFGFQDALGRSQMANGDTRQAVLTFLKIAAAQPSNPQIHLRLADVHILAKDYPAAKQSLNKALETSPKLLVAQQMLIQTALAGRQFDEAVKIAQTVQMERPKEPVGFVMEGEIQAGQHAWEPAFRAFRSALDLGRSTELATRLHAIYIRANRPQDAEKFAISWLKDRPRDASFLFHLGSMAMDVKEFGIAEAHYREVLALSPDNAAALNNVAWLMIKQDKPGALQFAERANQLQPEQPSVLDTLAMAYAAEKLWPKAVESQRKAVDKAPEVPGYRMSLAKLLIASGDRLGAKVELKKLETLGGKVADQAEVATLLRGL